MPKLKTTSQKINGWNIQQTDNHPDAIHAKSEIRRRVLEQIGAAQAHVLDAFAGAGTMYRAVWHQAASCVGCDIEKFCPDDQRLAYVADNCRVMRCIDLAAFNIFDFDAYGSPWEPVYLMIKRRPVAPGERIGVVLTEGQGMKMSMGGMSGALSLVAGVRQYMPGMGAAQQDVINRALMRTAAAMRATIERQWQATSKASSTIRYIGVVMRGDAAALTPAPG
jgi:hypothetical protein